MLWVIPDRILRILLIAYRILVIVVTRDRIFLILLMLDLFFCFCDSGYACLVFFFCYIGDEFGDLGDVG